MQSSKNRDDMISNKTYTASEFEAFIQRPENSDRLFEFINGEMIEKVPGRTRYSEFALIIATAVRIFCLSNNIPCRMSSGDGAYRIGENIVAPNFAYKRTPTSETYPDPEPPLWAVEVISPTDTAKDIRAKRRIYQAARILLWEVYYEDRTVDVYLPGQSERIEFGMDDVLDGGAVLPGFTLAVKEIFAV
jgi:Uma2 family endonuclease